MKLPKTFIGYSNIKWLIIELIKMYSSESSFFSKKRIESGVAFIILQWGMIYYLIQHILKMDMMEMVMWAGVEATICGYALNMIEKSKNKKPIIEETPL